MMSDNTYKYLTVFLAVAALAVALLKTQIIASGSTPGEAPACTDTGSSTPCR